MLSSFKKIRIAVSFLPIKKKKYNFISCLHDLCPFELLLHSLLLLSVTVFYGHTIICQRLKRRCKAWVILKLHFYLGPDSKKQAGWLCKNCIIQHREGIFTWANLDRTSNVIFKWTLVSCTPRWDEFVWIFCKYV